VNDSEVPFLSSMLPATHLLGILLRDFDRVYHRSDIYGSVLVNLDIWTVVGVVVAVCLLLFLAIMHLSSQFDTLPTR